MRAAAALAATGALVIARRCLGAPITTAWTEEAHPSASIAADAYGKAYAETRGPSGAQMEGSGAPEYSTADALSFTTTNEYPPVEHSKWPLIAEPFRVTTFTASSTFGDPNKDVFKWSFEDGTVLEGRELLHTFTTVGPHEVGLAQIVVATGDVLRMHAPVMVKYVRREIRQLTNNDREAFFDAMETLYRLPTAEGTALYGEEYKGINFFMQLHLDGAGVKDCDHWHDEAGIMTHHVGYTLLFEQALQVVDPSVSIPYWEYTIEAAQGITDYGESRVFAPDWFGDASPENSLHTVDGGRWAYLPIMKDAWEHVHNPYGLLRSPWNLDGTPFVTRYNKTNGESLSRGVVLCSDYQSCFESSSLADMNQCLNGATHGPVHTMVGGCWGNPEQELTIKLGYSSDVPIMSKILWRKGYLRLPATCSQEEHGLGDATTCRTSCPAELYESRGMTPYDVLMDVLAVHWIAADAGGIIVYDEDADRFFVAGHEGDDDFHDEIWKRVLRSLCDPGHVGDFFASSSPYDPLFWVLHPPTDRLLGWRRKLAAEQPDVWPFDETWGFYHAHSDGETGVVCDWSGVREDSLDMPTCVKSMCGGHRVGDTLPFEIKVKGETIKMTNLEWYKFIYPDNDDLPYMYNDFSWDHCSAEGAYIGTRGE